MTERCSLSCSAQQRALLQKPFAERVCSLALETLPCVALADLAKLLRRAVDCGCEDLVVLQLLAIAVVVSLQVLRIGCNSHRSSCSEDGTCRKWATSATKMCSVP